MHFEGTLNSKLPEVGTTIFTVMSKLANDHKAINLSQGFPDFECAPELIALVNENMHKGHNQYAPMAGYIGLRERIVEKCERLYGAMYHPETEITITSGATQAIYTAITSTVREGDEVVIFEPAYDCYAPAVELCGATPVYVQLRSPDFKINWDEVKKLINHSTRMIVINSPHNPTGTVMSKDDMLMLQKITKGTNILVLSDEVYEHVIFDGTEHQSIMRYKELASRSFVIASFGKTFHTTGWKMGYCLAPENLMKEFRKVHQYVVFASNTPIQYALADYMKNENSYLNLGEFYQRKRDVFLNGIDNDNFVYKPSLGTYFQLLDYSKLTGEADKKYSIELIEKFKIASVPISVFYHEGLDQHLLRFCFAKKESTLQRAVEIINQIQ